MIHRLILLSLVVTTAIVHAAAPAHASETLDPQRLTQLLQDRDPLLVQQIFRRNPQSVLPFIDQFLEGALKQIEEGASESAAQPDFDRGVAFARIASTTFDDTIFERYAASFASWDEAERARFRAAQRAYLEGVRLERSGEFDRAMREFRRALHSGERLDDTWGTAMSLAGLARGERQRGNRDEAVQLSRRAGDLYRRLRLIRQEAEAMLIAAEALEDAGMTRPSLTNSSRAYAVLIDAPHDELRQRAIDTFLRGLDAAGQTEEAERIRKQELDRAAAMQPATDD